MLQQRLYLQLMTLWVLQWKLCGEIHRAFTGLGKKRDTELIVLENQLQN
jgi:hypothetical protein